MMNPLQTFVAIHVDYEAVEEDVEASIPLPSKPENPLDMLTNVDIRILISHIYLSQYE